MARALGVSVRTVRRYDATGRAPKASRLCLFWLTSWGRSMVNEQAHADAQLAMALVRSLTDDVHRLESRVAGLLRIGHFGAANDPDSFPGRPSRGPATGKGKPE